MSRGPGQLQRAILEFMRREAFSQREPQRRHWELEGLVVNIVRRDPSTGKLLLVTSRQNADARKRIRRACDGLAATGKLVKFGVTWALPPETPQEARARRKRYRISERAEREQQEREQKWQQHSAWLAGVAPTPINPTTRRKLIGVLGQLGSDNPNVVSVAARQAERLRLELGLNWDELIATRSQPHPLDRA